MFFEAKRIKILHTWRSGISSSPSNATYRAHVLVVKKIEYVRVAQICVESFLYHHPNSTVLIHTDQTTIKEAQRIFMKRIANAQVELLPETSFESMPWQACKIDVILRMRGTSDFFMDADLRWNGVLPAYSGITFFVNEFDMRQKSPFRQILQGIGSEMGLGFNMRNTSFFSFDSLDLDNNQLKDFMSFYKNFGELVQSTDVGVLDEPELMRLSEQISLSIFSDKWSSQISCIKSQDGFRDGRFVESSYFGATGSIF